VHPQHKLLQVRLTTSLFHPECPKSTQKSQTEKCCIYSNSVLTGAAGGRIMSMNETISPFRAKPGLNTAGRIGSKKEPRDV
jgi:hypothetical protein